MLSQHQACMPASIGRNIPRVARVKKDRKIIPKNMRIQLTANDPINLPALSKDRAVTVQKMAVSRAEISPR